ncbi:MAG TPA: hypothetical protein VFC23_06355 [Thermoanaerobaculia bacterium]|nr:hypothetical protein [Thermoanaerobaculia bacterium]
MSYDVPLFPLPQTPAGDDPASVAVNGPQAAGNYVGICFSGGGSRALSAAMGQLRGLKALGVLDDVFFMSSVSGGTWASALYAYLPASFSEDDFLGPVVAPQDITVSSIGQLPPNNLGSIPPQLSLDNILGTLVSLIDQGYSADSLWQGLVGTYILQPFGLWNQNFNGYPDKYYSLSKGFLELNGGILQRNPKLKASQFYVMERNRPFLVMNGSLVSNPTVDGSQLLPFESTQANLGVRNLFPSIGPSGQDVGGGLMEAFGMGSAWQQDLEDNLVKTTEPARPFSLCDVAGISSAAFAETFQAKFPWLDFLVPAYPYWPVYDHEAPTNAAYSYEFADGGSLEDTGITALLSRNLPNVIAFVNGATPLQKVGDEIVLDSQVQLLFGVTPTPESLRRKEVYRKPIPNDDPTFTQVFDSADYNALAEGLWAANSAGGPAMFTQTLTTVPNANFGIKSYTVRVLWVYNTFVQDWYNLLEDAMQWVVDFTLNFPNYDTVLQLNLSATEVNLLANLSCWNLQTNADMVLSLFNG